MIVATGVTARSLIILPSFRRNETSPKEPTAKVGIGLVWCPPPSSASGSAGAPSTSLDRVVVDVVRKNTKFVIELPIF